MSETTETTVICGAVAGSCDCGLPPDHDPPHRCLRPGCHGSWTGMYGADDFEVITFPGPGPGEP